MYADFGKRTQFILGANIVQENFIYNRKFNEFNGLRLSGQWRSAGSHVQLLFVVRTRFALRLHCELQSVTTLQIEHAENNFNTELHWGRPRISLSEQSGLTVRIYREILSVILTTRLSSEFLSANHIRTGCPMISGCLRLRINGIRKVRRQSGWIRYL